MTDPFLGSFVVPPIPADLGDQQEWHRFVADAYLRGEVDEDTMGKVRVIFRDQRDAFRVAYEGDKARAALRIADSQERMADVLASLEHGGAAVVMLQRLAEGVAGRRRPLPSRVVRGERTA